MVCYWESNGAHLEPGQSQKKLISCYITDSLFAVVRGLVCLVIYPFIFLSIYLHTYLSIVLC